MRHGANGLSLPELLVGLLLVSVVVAGIGGVFASQNRAYRREDLRVAVEENLRVASEMIAETLRNAGCGTPRHGLSAWIPWAPGFADDPVVSADGGTDPDTLSVATCTTSVARLTGAAAAGDTTLTVASEFPTTPISDLLNDADKALVWIDHRQHALITSVGDDTITVDTDPITSGNQGIWRAQPAGTPIARVDVFTFEIAGDPQTGLPQLRLDKHRGTPFVVAEGISDLRVSTVEPRRRYRVTLTGGSGAADPVTGLPIARTTEFEVTLRN
jgi:hypothetical protein